MFYLCSKLCSLQVLSLSLSGTAGSTGTVDVTAPLVLVLVEVLELDIYAATRSLCKCGLRAVFVAHDNPGLGLSSRQARPKTPVSSRYRAIAPKKNHWSRGVGNPSLHV
jgi:hypothetical protein